MTLSPLQKEEKLLPTTPSERTRWIMARRGPKNQLDPRRAYAALWEEETGPDGEPIPTATLFLTNRECPYRCLMCDLWQNTLDTQVPVGAIPEQIAFALAPLPPARHIKLYNAGSFFDPQAIPTEDYEAIARLCVGFERVIVESHPAFIGVRAQTFQHLLKAHTKASGKASPVLEVAVGLETVHPPTLERLNKRFAVADFQRSAAFLAANDMALRVFLLVRPPFLTEAEGVEWACRSLDTAFDAGASVACLIPTRAGNGAMDALAAFGDFTPPRLESLEAAQEYGLRQKRGRVFVDLWDIEKFYSCACSPACAARLAEMNRTQTIPPPIICTECAFAKESPQR